MEDLHTFFIYFFLAWKPIKLKAADFEPTVNFDFVNFVTFQLKSIQQYRFLYDAFIHLWFRRIIIYRLVYNYSTRIDDLHVEIIFMNAHKNQMLFNSTAFHVYTNI